MERACSLIFILLILPFTAKAENTADYYWRNYNGVVPKDAYEAGVSASGKPFYVGLAFFVNVGVLPGTLYEGSTTLGATAQTRNFTTDKNVYILCTLHPKNFRWVQVNSYNDIAVLSNVHLVVGGVETELDVHIAKVFHEGDSRIGKIYALSANDVKATYPTKSGAEQHYYSFHILIYDFDAQILDIRTIFSCGEA